MVKMMNSSIALELMKL